jgi:hypothetical protein
MKLLQLLISITQPPQLEIQLSLSPQALPLQTLSISKISLLAWLIAYNGQLLIGMFIVLLLEQVLDIL